MPQDEFTSKWEIDGPLEAFDDFSKTVNKQIQEINKQDKPSHSLIPVKGISKVLQAKLRSLSIFDAPTLLARGNTQTKRDALAVKLDVNVKLVNSWIKQTDLWRVEGMSTDMAYLLVLTGVRCVEDLAKLDPNKAYPVLESLHASHVDFVLVDISHFKTLVNNAGGLYLLSKDMSSMKLEFKGDRCYQNT
jgi:hypothetical protein